MRVLTTRIVTCKEDASITLPCGHNYTGECHSIQEGRIKCMEKTTAKLDCGHFVTAPCHLISARLAKCYAKDSIVLSCGHIRRGQCHNIRILLSATPCGEKVRVSRDSCSHTLSVPCYISADSEKFPPCGVFVRNYRLSCGHSLSGKCNELVSGVVRCVVITQRELPCGHTIRGVCHRLSDGDHKCLRMVDSRLSCGHIAKVPCWIKDSSDSVKCMEEIEVSLPKCEHRQLIKCFESTIGLDSIECKQPCGSHLVCGCQCLGTCHTCRIRHPPCSAPCDKILYCGHTCDTLCPEMCEPCVEACAKGCRHRKCPNKCSEICESCPESCDNECFHRKCKKRCGQVCDVEPCTYPCRRRLPCTHPCLGMCGDNCPRICAICNKSQFLELTGKFEDRLFVQIQECDHIFGVKYLDLRMKESELGLEDWPCCPICNCSIRKSSRYQKTLNKFYQKLNERKKAIIEWGNQQNSEIEIEARRVLDEVAFKFKLNFQPLPPKSISYSSVACVWRRHTLLICSLIAAFLQDHELISYFPNRAAPILKILRRWYTTDRFSIHQLYQICQLLNYFNNQVSDSRKVFIPDFPQDWHLSECRKHIVKAKEVSAESVSQYEELDEVMAALRIKNNPTNGQFE
eukprot:Gregarina_sp_Poly_1__9349@NODE_581_length_7440_cov_35_488539_g380_i1_p2_GENE_NODE_581_length_7440_cov_35_488539_g380_i1NODE_581_length_7440_cov_35_488539_g380_i1_p2_ORF_typecomplete_len628_score13_10_NODE_581_length_7440_cov_35_488539_g380_i112593142